MSNVNRLGTLCFVFWRLWLNAIWAWQKDYKLFTSEKHLLHRSLFLVNAGSCFWLDDEFSSLAERPQEPRLCLISLRISTGVYQRFLFVNVWELLDPENFIMYFKFIATWGTKFIGCPWSRLQWHRFWWGVRNIIRCILHVIIRTNEHGSMQCSDVSWMSSASSLL